MKQKIKFDDLNGKLKLGLTISYILGISFAWIIFFTFLVWIIN